MNYYREQLERLNKKSEYITFKFSDGEGERTNYITLNKESVAELKLFLSLWEIANGHKKMVNVKKEQSA